jgi:methyl-accepting chemotaxis protein
VQKAIVDAASSVKSTGNDTSKDLVFTAFQSLKRQLPEMGDQYQGIFVADVIGMIYTGVLSGGNVYKAIDLSKNPAFQDVKTSSKPVISEMIISKATGKPATAALVWWGPLSMPNISPV